MHVLPESLIHSNQGASEIPKLTMKCDVVGKPWCLESNGLQFKSQLF